MTISLLNPVTAVLHNRVPTGDVDRYNKPILSDDDVVVPGCAWWQGTSAETVQGQDQVTSDAQLLMPSGTVVTETAELTVAGTRYAVASKPVPLISPLSGLDVGVLVDLLVVTG